MPARPATQIVPPDPDFSPDPIAAALEAARAECLALRRRNEALERRLADLAADLAEGEEARLRALQAQKLEAIGQLTGGIAHDFNNLLMVVRGGLYLLPIAAADPVRRDRLIRRMEGAVGRGAEVTRRLLAFARRELLHPEPIDLRRDAADLAPRLAAVLGEPVACRLSLADDLWPLAADRVALELALLNLAENARDAMRRGGTFTLSAANRSLTPEAAERLALPAGQYVEIACADSGHGMSPEVLARAFDPFFTTKPVGRGNGLGLPQVHGFVHQSGGATWVESRPDVGTIVFLLLPRAAAACRDDKEPS